MDFRLCPVWAIKWARTTHNTSRIWGLLPQINKQTIEEIQARRHPQKPPERTDQDPRRIYNLENLFFPPCRFRLTLLTPDLQFNHRVKVDTIFLNVKQAVHLVDEIINSISASFIRNQCTKEIWKAISILCFYKYMGPPDFLVVDKVTP